MILGHSQHHEPLSHGPWDLTHDIALTLENQRNMRREITTLQGTLSRTFLKTAQPLRQTASLDHLTTRLAGSPTRLQPQIISLAITLPLSLSLSISLIYIYIYIWLSLFDLSNHKIREAWHIYKQWEMVEGWPLAKVRNGASCTHALFTHNLLKKKNVWAGRVGWAGHQTGQVGYLVGPI